MSTPTELDSLLAKVQYNLTTLKAQVSEVQRQIAALNITPATRPKCPECDLTFKGALSLAEHLYNQHDGPLPPHYDQAELQADEPADDQAEPEAATTNPDADIPF